MNSDVFGTVFDKLSNKGKIICVMTVLVCSRLAIDCVVKVSTE